MRAYPAVRTQGVCSWMVDRVPTHSCLPTVVPLWPDHRPMSIKTTISFFWYVFCLVVQDFHINFWLNINHFNYPSKIGISVSNANKIV